MKRRASETMSPHSGVGGWAPRPRKLKVENSITEKAKRIVISTTMGATAFGSISRRITKVAPSPLAIAALT
jgi:hypothetical protein